MSMTEATVDATINKLDDNLQPLETPTAESKKPDVPDVDVTEPEKGRETEDDKGYTADEVEGESEEEPKEPTESEVKPLDTSGLNTEDKYIIDNLPVITTRIMDGEKVKEVQVKSWTQLPEDVTFATKRDELAFMNALTAQENRAQQLQRDFRQSQQDQQSKDFERRESETVRQDIAELQKEGALPKFKVKVDDPGFSKDPATQEVQKILDFMDKQNKSYLDSYNAGRSYKHIGFKEAFALYQRVSPPKSSAQSQEDKERRGVADKVGGNHGLSNKELKKSTVHSGTRIDDILNRIEQENW